MSRGLARWPAVVLAILALQFVVGSEWLVRPIVVSGPSMEPELREGDRLLVDVWTYRHRAPRPTEVVVVAAPGPARTLLVKRAGRRSPVLGPPRPDDPPGGRVWVEGDNPEDSLDSRQLGEIAEDRVAGRVVLRYWPLSRLGLVR